MHMFIHNKAGSQKQKEARKPYASGLFCGRSGGTRTRGLLVPNQTRYQTALHLDGADKGTRTLDLMITNQPLYQLSYIGSLPVHTSAFQYSIFGRESQ